MAAGDAGGEASAAGPEPATATPYASGEDGGGVPQAAGPAAVISAIVLDG